MLKNNTSAMQRLLAVAKAKPSHQALDLRDGGQVRGKGTTTSDSIDAKLSKKEFVLPADTTKAVGVNRLRALVHATHKPTGKAKQSHHYADGGLVEDESQALRSGGSQPSTPTREDLIAQIPVETDRQGPARQQRGFVDGLKQTEVGRQAFNTAMAIPGAGGLARVLSTGGAISSGLSRLAAIGNSASTAAAADAAVGEAGKSIGNAVKEFGINEAKAAEPEKAAEAGTASNNSPTATAAIPPASATTATGAAASGDESTAKVSAPVSAQVAPGIYSHGKGQFSDSASGMGFGDGFTGKPSTANDRLMQGLASQSAPGATATSTSPVAAANGSTAANTAQVVGATGQGAETAQASTSKPRESWSAFVSRMLDAERGSNGSGFGGGAQAPQMRSPTAVHSGNDWHARQALSRLKTAANGIYRTKSEKTAAEAAYMKGMLADQTAIGGQAALDAEAMKTNADLLREGMGQQGANSRTAAQEAGANRREGLRSLADLAKFNREAPEQDLRMRGLQRLDQAQEELVKAQNPAQASSARARLLALHGKSGQEQTKWRSGNDRDGNPFLYNEATAETRHMSAPTVSQPPADGSFVRGKDGFTYEVRNGVPVRIGG